MRRPSLFVLVLAGWLATLLLSACGTELPGAALQSPLPEPSAQTGGVAVSDALGQVVEFLAPPQRIVVAGQAVLPIVDTLYLFPEASQRVVALVVGKQPIGDFISLIDPGWAQKALLEMDAGPEQIAALKPDVVLLRSSMAEKLGRLLAALGLPVVYLDLETPEQVFRDVGTLGQLFGDEARAQEITAFYQARLDSVQQALQGLSDDRKPRVLVVQYSEQGGELALNVPPASWIQTAEAELAGGVPVWTEAAQGGGWTVVDFEQIAAWNPDQVFVISYSADSSAVVAHLEADSQWQALRAVQEGEIYGFPADIFGWDQPDPRWILGVTWLAGKVHPERFPGLDMKQQAAQFFEEMFGMDPAIVQQQIVLKLEGDVE
jgi:iron complex transport system substrate-binding protein